MNYHFIRLVLGSMLFGFCLNTFASPVPQQVQVQLSPGTTVSQGGLLLVTVSSAEPLPKGAKAKFLGKSMPLFWQADRQYSTVFGVNADQVAKVYSLEIVSPEGAALVSPQSVTVKAKSFGTQNIAVSKSTGGLQPIPGELEAVEKLKQVLTPVKHWTLGQFVSPTIDCENSPFGVRRYHNGKYTGNYHKGVDLRSPLHRAIRATAGGVVQIATQKFRLHGGTVGIDHGQGLSSIYIHMSKVLVSPGELVKTGQVIGEVGSTGFATGPHLHWGLYASGQPVDPNLLVPFSMCK